MPENFIKEWRARDIVHDVTQEEQLGEHLRGRVVTAYVGFDPTSDSLHVGSLLPLLALRRFQLAGHRPIVLVGGGTGLIGDPSGKAGERTLNAVETVHAWAERLGRQMQPFLDFNCGQSSAVMANNYEWLGELDMIGFLRDYGKHFSVATMINKESVNARLGSGISFTEFSYMILQSIDFLFLRRRYNCTLQLGGSDQWGNITAGIDLVRRLDGAQTYGLTLPLVAKSDGTKFGKTESGTIWLDAGRTSPYEMYQFWLNTSDADVVKFLKYFTFLSPDEISHLEEVTRARPEKREGQRTLAREVTRLVHSETPLAEAERITAAFFEGRLHTLSESELRQAVRGAPTTSISDPTAVGILDLLVQTGVAKSKSTARELVLGGGITVNSDKISDVNASVARSACLFDAYLLIKKGKKTYHVVEWR